MIQSSLTETNAAQARALDLLRNGRRFLLCGHVRPDGDCLGAQAALARVLTAMGKDVWIQNTDAPEPRFDYLARDVKFGVYQGGDLPRHDVSVLLDFCELSRTGSMEPALAAHASKKLVIDHHVAPGVPWWDEAYVDVRASATGILVRRIAAQLGVPLDVAAARGVFTSIVTDTGWFKYSNTDAETLAAAAEMTALGVVPNVVYAALHQRQPLGHPPALARAIERLEYHADGRLAVVDIPLGPVDSGALDTDEVLDILRAVERVEVVLLLREMPAGGVKLSARSKGDFDVHALARQFGGGGHKKASGATVLGTTMADFRARLVAATLAALGETAATGAGPRSGGTNQAGGGARNGG
ncbi:MAG: DHHA1 domain-containing protein [Planctomycetota bacterium]|nr:DHHA1 domain-containing protein [Planctomycetota bacterium]